MKKETCITIRCRKAEKEQIKQAAENENLSMSEYLLTLAKESSPSESPSSGTNGRQESPREIKSIISNSGMSLKELSRILGIPYRTLQNWKDGKRCPADWVVNLIAFRLENQK